MIDEMCRGLGQAPGVARGADGAAFTGEGLQEVVSALIATRSRQTVGQDAALQIAAQLALGVGRGPLFFSVVAAQSKEGFEVVLHRPVERCCGGAAPAVGVHPCDWTAMPGSRNGLEGCNYVQLLGHCKRLAAKRKEGTCAGLRLRYPCTRECDIVDGQQHPVPLSRWW